MTASRTAARWLERAASSISGGGSAYATVGVALALSALAIDQKAGAITVAVATAATAAIRQRDNSRSFAPTASETAGTLGLGIAAALAVGDVAASSGRPALALSVLVIVALGAVLPRTSVGVFAVSAPPLFALEHAERGGWPAFGAAAACAVAIAIAASLDVRLPGRDSRRSSVIEPFVRRPVGGFSPDAEHRAMRDAVIAVRSALRNTLASLRSALDAHTATALWIDPGTALIEVRAAVGDEQTLRAAPFADRAGVLEVARKQRGPSVVNDIRGSTGFLPWRDVQHEEGHVAIVPLYDEGLLLGYLTFERRADADPFGERECDAIGAAARSIVATVNTERLVVDADASRRQMQLLYEAADAMAQALSPIDVCRAALEIVARVVPIDVFVVTAAIGDPQRHRVLFANGVDIDGFVGSDVATDRTLADVALRRQHPQPYSGRLTNPETAIWCEQPEGLEIRSLLVFPLVAGQRSVGTLGIGAFVDELFTPEVRDNLRLVVSYVAAALSNALAYDAAVVLATTDMMTGLANRRTFVERGAEALARSERSSRPCSLLVFDIDRFKSVNDTYGHAVGDDVIRGVAQAARETVRKTDLAARYGGEEFAVILEETDADAATLLAERIRQAVRADEYDGGDGRRFRVSISIGVATAPRDGTELQPLFEKADAALYAAKRGGRDRVVRYDTMPAEPGDDG